MQCELDIRDIESLAQCYSYLLTVEKGRGISLAIIPGTREEIMGYSKIRY